MHAVRVFPRRTERASLVHGAGVCMARLWTMNKLLAATDALSLSFTRLPMPIYQSLCSVRVVCARVCEAAVPLHGAG